MKTRVEYSGGYNTSKTKQHEVLAYVYTWEADLGSSLAEGPHVVLYTESDWAAKGIAAILNADAPSNVPTQVPFKPFAGGPWALPHEER
jgi:hypothetical protein